MLSALQLTVVLAQKNKAWEGGNGQVETKHIEVMFLGHLGGTLRKSPGIETHIPAPLLCIVMLPAQ